MGAVEEGWNYGKERVNQGTDYLADKTTQAKEYADARVTQAGDFIADDLGASVVFDPVADKVNQFGDFIADDIGASAVFDPVADFARDEVGLAGLATGGLVPQAAVNAVEPVGDFLADEVGVVGLATGGVIPQRAVNEVTDAVTQAGDYVDDRLDQAGDYIQDRGTQLDTYLDGRITQLGDFVENQFGDLARGFAGDFIGGGGAVDAAIQAAEIQAGAATEGIAEQRRQFDLTRGDLQPFQNAGVSALQQQQDLLNNPENFKDSPGQRFLRQRAERSLLRNSAAIGGLGGGNVRNELQEQAIGMAAQDYNNQFSRLGQVAGQGQNTAVQLGQFGQNKAAQIGQLGAQSAAARASGILGAQQQQAQQRGQIFNAAGTALGAFLGG